MNIQYHITIAAQLAVALLLGATSAQDEFQPIATSDLGTVTSIAIGPFCEGMGLFPTAMFTIAPGAIGSDVVVSSSPSDLVSATTSNGELTFVWNNAVANTAAGGGVRIEVPADTLKSVTVNHAALAQVLEGFTSITTMDVNGASVVRAKLSTLTAGSLSLSVNDYSTVNLDSNVSVTGKVDGGSKANIATPLFNNFHIDGYSWVGVVGNVGSGSLDEGSSITFPAGSCAGVSTASWSTCNIGVTAVDVKEQPSTQAGVRPCAWNAAPALPSLYSAIATLAAAMLASGL